MRGEWHFRQSGRQFLAKIHVYATRQRMVALRLDCVMVVPFLEIDPQ